MCVYFRNSFDRLATANEVRWCGHVLKKDDDSVVSCSTSLNKWQEKVRKAKELEEACGRRDKEDQLKKKRCTESSKVETWSANNCRSNWVNPAISATGTTWKQN